MPTIEEVFSSLASSAGRPSAMTVKRLSGLRHAQVSRLGQLWPKLAIEQRRQVVRLAVDLAEDAVELDFSDFFKVCLEDTDELVRATAAEGLSEDEDYRTADRLGEMLRSDPSPVVREATAIALRHFALLGEWGTLYPPAAQRLRAVLLESVNRDSELIDVRRRAVESLGAFSGDDVSAVIVRSYHDEHPRMRASALFAMGQSCDVRWFDTILAELENENPELRYEAARASGEIGDQRGVVPLINLLKDEDREVRLAAIAALGAIGGPIARRALQTCRRGGDEALASAAADALDDIDLDDDLLGSAKMLHERPGAN